MLAPAGMLASLKRTKAVRLPHGLCRLIAAAPAQDVGQAGIGLPAAGVG
jgi:hypothetical protein